MKTRTLLLALLCSLMALPTLAYPPAPYYLIHGTVRDDRGNPLTTGTATVIFSGIYSALGSATVSSGAITGVTVLNGGSGFTSVPTVVFNGGSGTGATGVAVLTNGVVTGVTVTNPGSGYTAPVTVGISGGGAPSLEILRAPIDSSGASGINYSLFVPMDSGTSAQLYQVTALRPLLPFTIRVVINGVNYVPLQIAGAPSLFWKNQINTLNPAPSPGIQSQGNNWAAGLPAAKLRLNLWLGIDSNNDGLPDEWQWDVVFSDPTGQLQDFTEVDPNAIFANGMTNLESFIAGVYPLEAADGLHFAIDSVTNGIAKLHFQAITGRTYHISASNDLVNWTNPQAFSVNSDASNPGYYYQADGVKVQDIYVSVVSTPLQFFRLYVE